jgi:protein involved in polysaccharide export with SLBB domain
VNIDELISLIPELDGVVMLAEDYMNLLEKKAKLAAEKGRVAVREYCIRPGVTLNIEVFGEPELTRSVTVGPDGVIDYPYVGEIKAEGLTIRQFKQHLIENLKRILKDPMVVVNPSPGGVWPWVAPRIRGGTIAIFGAVSYGRLVYSGGERLSQILSGALPGNAEWRQIRVFTKHPLTNKDIIVVADFYRLFHYCDRSQDIPIYPDDIIYVPFTFTIGEHIRKDIEILHHYATRAISFDQMVGYFEDILPHREPGTR